MRLLWTGILSFLLLNVMPADVNGQQIHNSSQTHTDVPQSAHDTPHADDPIKQREHLALLDMVSDAKATAVHTGGPLPEPVASNAAGTPSRPVRLVIPAGVTGIVDHEYAGTYEWIRVDGTLEFAPGVDTNLKVVSLVGLPGATLSIQPQYNKMAVITIMPRGPLDRDNDPADQTGCVMWHSEHLNIRGRTTTAWAQPTSLSGDTITLDATPLAWDVGDELIVPGVGSVPEQVVTITEGLPANSFRVSPALTGDRTLADGTLPVVGNLTRNVVIRSESTEPDQRGHVMVMHVQTGTSIKYAAFENLGRTRGEDPATSIVLDEDLHFVSGDENTIGRYPLHYHVRSGADINLAPHQVEGCVVRGAPGNGIVIHGAHAKAASNVVYAASSSGIFTENGLELGDIMSNLVVASLNTAYVLPNAGGDLGQGRLKIGLGQFGFQNHCIWLQGGGVEVRGNHCYGCPKTRALIGGYFKGIEPGHLQFPKENLRPGPTKDSVPSNHPSVPIDRQPFIVENNKGSGAKFGLFVAESQFSNGGGKEFSRCHNNTFMDVTEGVSGHYMHFIEIQGCRLYARVGTTQGGVTSRVNTSNYRAIDNYIEGFKYGYAAVLGNEVVTDNEFVHCGTGWRCIRARLANRRER